MKARDVAALAAALTLTTIRANCPSFCMGNGICGADDKCSCHQGWGSPDCSQRQCPFVIAWADTADGTNQAHYYAECGNKGICDRKSGLCQCFAGYEGKGCRRSACPDACSGHGTCEYIDELAGDYQDRRTGPGHAMQDMSCKDTRAFPSKSGAWSDTIEMDNLADTNLLVLSDEQNEGTRFYANAYHGMPVKYSTPPSTSTGTSASEVQTVTSTSDDAMGGTFTLTYDSQTTGNIPAAATAAELQTALEALSNIPAGGVTVVRGTTAGNGFPYTVTWTDAGNRVAITSTVTSLTGTSAAVAVVTTTEGTTPALVSGTTYYLYKHATAMTFVVFTTEAAAQATNYANDAAAKAAGLDVKTDAAAGAIHTWTEANRDSCDVGSIITSNAVSRTANTDVQHGYLYNEWDAGMMQGCKCDLGYDGPDCGHRIPPHGDDPLTTVKSNAMKQAIKIFGAVGTKFDAQEFSMVYHDPYGGIWRTPAIDGSNDDHMVASRVEWALHYLPNEVLDGVKVTGTATTPTICHRFYDGLQHYGAHTQYHIGHGKDPQYRPNHCKHESSTQLIPADNDMDFTVEFNKKPGQTGVQYLFEVDMTKRGPGSYPLSAGITGSSSYSVAEISYNHDIGNISELAECSDRGLDDGDGQCECFEGFRGLACEKQEALV